MTEWNETPTEHDKRKRQYLLQLLNVAQMRLVGASVAGLKAELFDTLREMFGDSGAWMEDISLTVVPSTTPPSFQLQPSSGEIIRLVGVMDANLIPQPATMPTIGTVFFPYPYTIVQTMTVRVAKNVTDPFECKGVPTFPLIFLSVHGGVLLDGLLGRMYMHPAASYSNMGNANYHLSRFRDGIARVRQAAVRANTLGVNSWAYPQQFRTRGQRGGVSVGNAQYFQ